MKMNCVHLGTLLVVMATRTAVANDLSREFLKDAPPAWASAQEQEVSFEGTGEFVEVPLPSRTPERRCEFSFKKSGTYMRDELEFSSAGSERVNRSAVVRGPNAGFTLSSASEGGPWQIKSITREPGVAVSEAIKEIGFLRYYEAPWTVAGVALADLVKSSGFRITEASESDAKGERTVRIAFTFSDKNPNDMAADEIQGVMTLLPARKWRVKDYDVIVGLLLKERPDPFKMRIQSEVEYDGERMFPRRVRYSRTDPGGSQEGSELTFSLHDFKVGPVPDEAFALSDFGLTDADEEATVVTSWTRWWILGLNVVVIAVVIMVLLRRRRT